MKASLACFAAFVMSASELFQFGAGGVTFFPFAGDLSLAKEDDAFTTIPLSFDLPFFGELFREIHVSTNGIIFFGVGSTSFTPVPFPLNGTKCVAAYWVDSDPRMGGDIFYREVFDPDLLRQITNLITSKFVNHATFKSSWAFIVTFSNVSRYDCIGSSVYPCHMVVNHQTILTSNGRESFVIFLYDKLGYWNGQIGFNAGDGKRFFLVPHSYTHQIPEYALNNSNVGEPGKWMFSISDEISSACGEGGLLEVYPKKVLFFGGQEVQIAGPCLPKDQSSMVVRFGQTNVNCSIVSGLKIVCTSPYLDVQGRVDLTLQFGNTSYKSFVVTHDVNDDVIKNKKLEVSGDNVDTPFFISWNVSSGQGQQSIIGGMQEDIVIDEFGAVISLERKQVFIKVSNTGSYEYAPIKFAASSQYPKSKTVRKIYLHVEGFVLQKVIIGAQLPFSCPLWHGAQPKQTEVERLKDISSRRNPCRPTVPTSFPFRLTGGFEIDDSCFPAGKKWCNAYRFGAKACYTSSNNPDSVATQCCYNDNGQLLIGPTGGGSLSTAGGSKSRHFTDDLLPYLLCCQMQNDCGKYYEKRPSVDSRHFSPPVIRTARGDPHFTTLDGTEYDFNPVGEFVYLQVPDVVVQTRISQFVDAVGNAKQASYFSAFAVKRSSESDAAQVEMTASKFLSVKVGNVSLQKGTTRMDHLFVDFVDDTRVAIETSDGVKLEVQMLNGMLHAFITLEVHLKGKVSGLIGNWDDNPENDFMLPNKTFIPLNSSNEDVHYKFGMAWSTTEQTSIFSYPAGLSWKDFQNKIFIPVFEVTSTDPRCNGDKNCLFDLQVTGDINAAMSNVEVRKSLEEIQAVLRETSETCPTNVNITNGMVDMTFFNSSDLRFVNYTIKCQPKYKLSGVENITCVKGKISSEFPLLCSSHISVHDFLASRLIGFILASLVLYFVA